MEKSRKKSKLALVFTTLISLSSVFTAAVTTFAWYQSASNSVVNVNQADSTTITASEPNLLRFYRFNGNGTPGGSGYTGYSNSAWSYGNTVNQVNTSNSTFTTNSGSTWTSTTWANAWTEINLSSGSEVINAFDFSRMRPGCYYSFCAFFDVDSTKLKLTFSWNNVGDVTGNSTSPKRFVYDNGNTSYPINVLMGVNGWANNSTQSGSSTFINSTFSVNTSNDKIVYTNTSSGTTSESYYLFGTSGSSATLSSNKYIYFTIFMGLPEKADALMYRGTSDGNSYYERGNSNGGYGALDGLKSTLSTIELL